MHRSPIIVFALGVLLSGLIVVAPSPGLAHGDEPPGTPAASGGHVAATPGAAEPAMGGTGAAYMVIRNTGAEDDRLVSGETAAARAVEFHEAVADDGVMQMRPLTNGLALPGGAAVTLDPGGYHVMLIGLTNDLKAGDRFDLTLRFERAGEVVVPVEVRTRPAAADAAGEPATIGVIEVSGAWARPAPALAGLPEATPAATPAT